MMRAMPTPHSNALLRIKDLNISLSNHRVLHDINLQISKGESVALVGESGSGKSVTAQAILQLIPKEMHTCRGEIWLEDDPLHTKTNLEMQQIRGKKIGMIFQNPTASLNPTISIGNQIAESFRYHNKVSKESARQQTIELLHLVGIADPIARYHAYPFQLSGGMCQRVMIAMTLAPSPQLLIADEPTTALDVTVQAQILNLLQTIRLEKNMALLLITHDLSIVAGNCDRVAVMKEGRIVETTTVDTFFSEPSHPYSQALLMQSTSYC